MTAPTLPPLDRLAPAAILAVSLGALAAALVAQYVFGLLPCILCLYQRVPYAVAAGLGALGLVPALGRRARIALVALAGLAFLANSGIAVFHVGVEQHWWQGTEECAGSGPQAMTPAELLRSMSRPAAVRCDQPSWDLFGITMAGYNVAASLLLGAASLVAARRMAKGTP